MYGYGYAYIIYFIKKKTYQTITYAMPLDYKQFETMRWYIKRENSKSNFFSVYIVHPINNSCPIIITHACIPYFLYYG